MTCKDCEITKVIVIS